MPDEMSMTLTLSYEPAGRLPVRPSRHSEAGTAGLVFAGIAVVAPLICVVGMAIGPGHDMAWFFWGALSHWSGTGFGFLLGLFGFFEPGRRRDRAAFAVGANTLIAGVPIAWLVLSVH